MNKSSNKVFIISAPAGTGKTTLVNMLVKNLKNVKRSISFTTRKPRKNEVDKKDYFFVTNKEFENKIKDNDFLEYAKVFNHYYGTSKSYVEKVLKDNHVILTIDVQGAFQVREKRKDTVLIFILPPSFEELKRRLKKRHTETAAIINERLQVAKVEIEKAKNYDYQVINDDLKIAYQKLKSIILKEEKKGVIDAG